MAQKQQSLKTLRKKLEMVSLGREKTEIIVADLVRLCRQRPMQTPALSKSTLKITKMLFNSGAKVRDETVEVLIKKSENITSCLKALKLVEDQLAKRLIEIVCTCSRTIKGTKWDRIISDFIDTKSTHLFLKSFMNHCKIFQQPTNLTGDYYKICQSLAVSDYKFSETIIENGFIKTLHAQVKMGSEMKICIFTPLTKIIELTMENACACTSFLSDGLLTTITNLLQKLEFTSPQKTMSLLNVLEKIARHDYAVESVGDVGILKILLNYLYPWDTFDNSDREEIAIKTMIIFGQLVKGSLGLQYLRNMGLFKMLVALCEWYPENGNKKLLTLGYHLLSTIGEKKTLPIKTQSSLKFDLPCVSTGKLEMSEHEGSSNSSGERYDRPVPIATPGKLFFQELYESHHKKYKILFREFLTERERERLVSRQTFITSRLSVLEEMNQCENFGAEGKDPSERWHSIYEYFHKSLKNVQPIMKVPHPEMNINFDAKPNENVEKMSFGGCKSTILKNLVDKGSDELSVPPVVIFDLDNLCEKFEDESLRNTEKPELDPKKPGTDLKFESRFECGNLWKALKADDYEYDLLLSPDINKSGCTYWFYYEVSNMVAKTSYKFNIINLEKPSSQFNYGMMPVMYSVKDASDGHPQWKRVGQKIAYHRNNYVKSNVGKKDFNYYTLSFTVEFEHSNDTCYIAYHYPYTYTRLMAKISSWALKIDSSIEFRADKLCDTLKGNEVPIITITSRNSTIKTKKIVFLTGRVHPGESNASWMMEGTISSLLGSSVAAVECRENFVFKIIPMLNVDGVVNGCTRYSLSAQDLNRVWDDPDPNLNPTIFHAKGLLHYLVNDLKCPPYLFCDYHGHSRKKNCFMFGCAKSLSWMKEDRESASAGELEIAKQFPLAMRSACKLFSFRQSRFDVTRDRESTARVSVWRQFGIPRSYTLETTFCGSDIGPTKGHCYKIGHLLSIGSKILNALLATKSEGTQPKKIIPRPIKPIGAISKKSVLKTK